MVRIHGFRPGGLFSATKLRAGVSATVSIKLSAEIEPIPGAAEIRDGWRGLLDFGETGTEDDADLWAPEWATYPAATRSCTDVSCTAIRPTPEPWRSGSSSWTTGAR